MRKRIAFAVVALTAAFSTIEICARVVDRLLGYPFAYLARFSESQSSESVCPQLPRLDIESLSVRKYPLKVRKRQRPFSISKPLGTYRLVVVGGSAAFGFGLKECETFAFLLEDALNSLAKTRKYEVFNCAIEAEDSTRMLIAMKQAMRIFPDAFIVYTGNNEFIRWKYPRSGIPRCKAVRAAQRVLHLSRAYLGLTWLCRLGANALKSTDSGYEIHHDLYDEAYCDRHPLPADWPFDVTQWPQIKAEYMSRFEYNLRAMAKFARRRQLTMILCTVPINYRLCTCWKHRQPINVSKLTMTQRLKYLRLMAEADRLAAGLQYEKARRLYELAIAIDPLVAKPHYRLARVLEKLGNPTEARREYLESRETMIGNLGSMRSVNETIRRVACEEDISLVDLARLFVAYNERRGLYFNENLIVDDCHPSATGHKLIADALCWTMKSLGLIQ